MAADKHPTHLALDDGTKWVTDIGPDRQTRLDNPGLNAIASVRTLTEHGQVRTTMREADFLKLAETGTPAEAKFANQALSELHSFERNPPGGAATPQVIHYEPPEIKTSSPAPVTALTNAPSPPTP